MGMKKGDKNSGQWQPGQSGNPNGRPKGAKDKRKRMTKKMREEMLAWASEILSFKNLSEAAEQMTAKEKLYFAEKICKHILPREKDIKKSVEGEVKITVKHKAPTKPENTQQSDTNMD